MTTYRQRISNFLNDESGPTAVEYAIILAVIVTTCMASMVFLGDGIRASFNFVANALTF
ncbi:MAG: Flp family type IVb pilin [Planctomycetota bacterium]